MKPEREVRNFVRRAVVLHLSRLQHWIRRQRVTLLNRVNSLSCNIIAKYVKIHDKYCTRTPPRKNLSKMLEGSKQKLGAGVRTPPTPQWLRP